MSEWKSRMRAWNHEYLYFKFTRLLIIISPLLSFHKILWCSKDLPGNNCIWEPSSDMSNHPVKMRSVFYASLKQSRYTLFSLVVIFLPQRGNALYCQVGQTQCSTKVEGFQEYPKEQNLLPGRNFRFERTSEIKWQQKFIYFVWNFKCPILVL